MRQVINSLPESNFVLAKDVVDVAYYGVDFINNPSKGYITREQWRQGKFTVRAIDHITDGNGWDAYDRPTLIGTIKALIEVPTIRVYEFETPKQLLAWLMKPSGKK